MFTLGPGEMIPVDDCAYFSDGSKNHLKIPSRHILGNFLSRWFSVCKWPFWAQAGHEINVFFFFRKDHYVSRDLSSTIPWALFFYGRLDLQGMVNKKKNVLSLKGSGAVRGLGFWKEFLAKVTNEGNVGTFWATTNYKCVVFFCTWGYNPYKLALWTGK